MRTLILKDKDIPKEELDEVIEDIREFYSKALPYTKRLIQYDTEELDTNAIDYEIYHSGYYGINKSHIANHASNINREHGSEYDNIVYMVHEDNWKPDFDKYLPEGADRLWGWNLSNAHQGYEIQQVRWDKDNDVNTFGTLNHEQTHSFDSYIYRKLGIILERKLGIDDWDDEVVHGGHEDHEYIGHVNGRENEEILGKIEPFIESAWATARLQRELEKDPSNTTLIEVIGSIISGFKERLRNYRYSSTHEDVPIKRSNVINNE